MRNMLAALLALFLIAFDLGGQARRFPFRQGSPSLPPNVTNWTAQIDEPAPPTLAVGGCFTNAHGNQVCRATGPATLNGDSVAHLYVDRSPFSADDRCIINNDANRIITNPHLLPATAKVVPSISGWTTQYSNWHPTLTYPRRLYAAFKNGARGSRLYYLDVAEDCTPGSWVLIKDFTSAINYNSSALSPLTESQKDALFPNLMGTNGDKFVIEIRQQSKIAWGIIQYQIDGDVLRVDLGRVATNVQGGTWPSNLRLVGVNVSVGSMSHIALQWDPDGGGNVRGTQSVWGANPLDGATIMFDPNVVIGHGSAFSNGYTNYINTGIIVGPPCDGGANNNYVGKIQRALTSDVTSYTTTAVMEICWKMAGLHLSSNAPGPWVIGSAYQVSALSGRQLGPGPRHEIFAFRNDQNVTWTAENTSGVFVNRGPVVRIGHHFSCEYCAGQTAYWTQPHASISTSEQYVAFSSNWCRTDAECAGGRYDIYVVRMPTLAP